MKSLNLQATEIFKQLITLADQNEGHISLKNNESFMAAIVERLYDVDFGGQPGEVFSIAHYGKQNGDLMADPEMTFLYLPINEKVFPMSFTNHYAGVYRECLFSEAGTWKVNKKELTDQSLFANDWMKNIKDQQKL